MGQPIGWVASELDFNLYIVHSVPLKGLFYVFGKLRYPFSTVMLLRQVCHLSWMPLLDQPPATFPCPSKPYKRSAAGLSINLDMYVFMQQLQSCKVHGLAPSLLTTQRIFVITLQM